MTNARGRGVELLGRQAQLDPEGRGPPAFNLLAEAAALAQELAPLALAPLPPQAELDFAVGIALHDEAVELAQRKSAETDAVVLESVRRLQSALGLRHALLVTPLANAARVHLDRGNRQAAEEALERALAILTANPAHDENEALRLLRLLDRVRTAA